MDELDKILEDFIKNKYIVDNSGAGEGCLSEELFAEYLGNLLDPSKKEQVEKHLDECEVCFQKSIMLSKVVNEIKNKEQPDMPREIIEKAKILVKGQSSKDIIEVVLEFGKNIINVIKDTAGICTLPEPAALSIRSSGEPGKGVNAAQLSKEFDGIKADIFVEKINDTECDIEARISDPASGELMDDIRVNLISGEKELASYLTVKGCASFKNLKFDTYVLKIYKGKDSIGSVLLKLSSV